MAQENLSVVLHAKGDLRLVRNRTRTQTFVCKIVQNKQLFFVCLNRIIVLSQNQDLMVNTINFLFLHLHCTGSIYYV